VVRGDQPGQPPPIEIQLLEPRSALGLINNSQIF